MERRNPVDTFPAEYDRWFDKHPALYQSEIEAISCAIKIDQKGIEIGAGTGRFSSPLNIPFSLDPSLHALRIAHKRGNRCIAGIAEHLPFRSDTFDYALMVTVDCFLNDIMQSFHEVHRVIRKTGDFVIAFIDRDSPVGESYSARKSESRFYQNAEFHSVKEIGCLLSDAGFNCLQKWQTVFGLEDVKYPISEGSGQGGFVVIRAKSDF